MTEDDDILAAEYALGLLTPEEAATAEARMRTDAPLSLRVAWWRDQLGPMVAEAAVEAPEHIWRAIETRLPANDAANDNARDPAKPWKWATGGMGAVAAALLAVVALRPDPAPVIVNVPPTAVPMAASVSGERGVAVAVTFDAASDRIVIMPVTLDPGAGDAELWVIPVGRTTPVSLGVIDARTPRSRKLDAAYVALLSGDATIAISLEAKGGSTTGAPQGPVVATGKLTRI